MTTKSIKLKQSLPMQYMIKKQEVNYQASITQSHRKAIQRKKATKSF